MWLSNVNKSKITNGVENLADSEISNFADFAINWAVFHLVHEDVFRLDVPMVYSSTVSKMRKPTNTLARNIEKIVFRTILSSVLKFSHLIQQ